MAEAVDREGRDVPAALAARLAHVRQPVAVHRVRSAAHVRRGLWIGAFLILVLGFSVAPALHGLSLAAGEESGASGQAADEADALVAAEVTALAARP